MATIEKSVGKGGVNLPIDVIKVQDLLNNNDLYTVPYCGATESASPWNDPGSWLRLRGSRAIWATDRPRATLLRLPLGVATLPSMTRAPASIEVNGVASAAMLWAIETFQINHPKLDVVDGRVDPGGATLSRLNEYHNSFQQCRSFLPHWFGKDKAQSTFNVNRFLNLYARQYPKPSLTGTRRSGLESLVKAIIADTQVQDIRWAAYMLATVKHECANTWQPIEEYGKGAGRPYGKVVKVVDPATKKTIKNTYYGRGYVQLTWESNYTNMDQALHLSGPNSLHLHPEKALVASTAYAIMSHGMRNGSFTGKKLSDYIGARTDYRNARRIINALDQADLIKGYAEHIEYLLRFCNGKS